MPTPPAAGSRWYSIRSSLTSAPGVRASKVADLMMRLRSVMGPSFAGASTSGASDMTGAYGDRKFGGAERSGSPSTGLSGDRKFGGAERSGSPSSATAARLRRHAKLEDVGAITLDGKSTRDEIFVDLKQRVAALTAAGHTPGLGTILVGDDPGSQAYVRGKHADCAKVGITSLRRDLPADISQAKLNETIDELNANPECTGYIVQLPLPKQLNENAALERVDPAKDADGLHPTNLGRLVLNTPAPLPCTPRGIVHLLRRFDVQIAGAHVVVIGRGVTVGRPLGLLLTRRSENATVTLCHTGTRDLPALTKQADIIVAGVGVPHMLTADMVRPGAAVVDVGVSRVDGKLAGDVHPDVWDVAGHVSPNPGGVGPLTRAFLLTNVVELAEGQ